MVVNYLFSDIPAGTDAGYKRRLCTFEFLAITITSNDIHHCSDTKEVFNKQVSILKVYLA